jgi:hypothetical protein
VPVGAGECRLPAG